MITYEPYLLTIIGCISLVLVIGVASYFHEKWKGIFKWWDRHGKKHDSGGTG